MPDNGEQNPNNQPDPQEPPATGDDALGDAGKQALDRMKAERNEANRQLRATQRELEQVRQASMSDAEKAIAEAKAAGRTEAVTTFGKRLAKSALETAIAKRNPDYPTKGIDYLDLTRFVGEDGEPNAKEITAYVEASIPTPNGAPSFDGGARQAPPKSGDMNSIIRKAAGRA